MKLIIDIPYEAYYTFKCDSGKGNLNALGEIVANGTPITEDDCISRSALKEELEAYRHTRNYKSDEDEAQNSLLDNILEDIDNAPTLESFTKDEYEGAYLRGFVDSAKANERPKGEWEDYSVDFYKCPECGYLLNKDCPHCQNKVILPKGEGGKEK